MDTKSADASVPKARDNFGLSELPNDADSFSTGGNAASIIFL